jgi:cobyrinic acid a,c-diamide synthase
MGRNRSMKIPRLMIAAPQGRSGKTTVAIGLCAVLRKKGLQVKPFKKGPDYIDPSWLAAAAASKSGCTNLDTFLFSKDILLQGFQKSCAGADLAVIEASMGLYDSSFENGKGSSAWLSRHLQTPIILVVNCARMTRSTAAMVSGYMNFEKGTHIAGVILNNISGQRHANTIMKALEHHCGIPVLGVLPKDTSLCIPERHLGIVPAREHSEAEGIIGRISDFFERNADVDRIIQVACTAPDLPDQQLRVQKPVVAAAARIGVLSDSVFTFYYPENLQALEQAGAELVYIDSLHDKGLPDIDALYIGGGFPELYAHELEANVSLRKDIAQSAGGGLPVYAECAGLMYLCRSIRTAQGEYQMCGVIDADVTIGKKPVGHGYVMSEVTRDNPFFTRGAMIYGHEFHYSKLKYEKDPEFAFRMRRGFGVNGINDGVMINNLVAAYAHIHAWGVPEWAPAFLRAAVHRSLEKNKIKV